MSSCNIINHVVDLIDVFQTQYGDKKEYFSLFRPMKLLKQPVIH